MRIIECAFFVVLAAAIAIADDVGRFGAFYFSSELAQCVQFFDYKVYHQIFSFVSFRSILIKINNILRNIRNWGINSNQHMPKGTHAHKRINQQQKENNVQKFKEPKTERSQTIKG